MWQTVALCIAWATVTQAVVLRTFSHEQQEQVNRTGLVQSALNWTASAQLGAADLRFHENARHSASALDYGNLQCMRWTGGTCQFFACFLDRGKTECVEGKCMCPPGYCSSTKGACEYGNAGKALGTHAVRFVNAHDQSQPYLGVTESANTWDNSAAVVASVPSAEDSSAQWEMVLTPHGYVRFESRLHPQQVLTIYNSRRRRSRRRRNSFLQVEEHGTNASDSSAHERADGRTAGGDARAGISDDDDLWPQVRNIETVTPLEASFLVREVSGGLEIWDPDNGVSLSSADRNKWFEDGVAKRGIAECTEKTWFSDGCNGRELVAFEPPLAEEALSPEGHILVTAISNVRWYHIALWVLVILACGIGCAFACGCIDVSEIRRSDST
eukprot:TRINITY_DN20914_c0_g2_i1.p1 TRINITY_DN20914_c0_g2~~TRINITY_DN20914_c0_g2_i1.p1  ORF type:complete len:385 (-),score=33.90 TRINITY_DN20914_c0_g2_i1:12-1166(-)